MTFLAVLLGALLVLGVVASLLAGLFATQLNASDAAGNGLAQAWFVLALLAAWGGTGVALFVGSLVAEHGGPFASVVAGLFVAAAVAQIPSTAALCSARRNGVATALLAVLTAVVPIGFAAHVAWRALAVPLPVEFATWGCVAVGTAGAVLPWLVAAAVPKRSRAALPAEHRVVYPALLLHGERSVRVVRGADELSALPAADLAEPDALLVDAEAHGWSRSDGVLTRATAPLALETIIARLLAIPRLHEDPAEDANVRHLIGMQRDVTALTFVLPR